MHTLKESVEPRGSTRPIEGGQRQPSDVSGDRLAELRTVGDIGQQPGQDHHGQPDQQCRAEYRGQPGPPQRAGASPSVTGGSSDRCASECPPDAFGGGLGAVIESPIRVSALSRARRSDRRHGWRELCTSLRCSKSAEALQRRAAVRRRGPNPSGKQPRLVYAPILRSALPRDSPCNSELRHTLAN